MKSLCVYKDSLGVAGEGFHAARVPGTDTALNDYVGTLLISWALAAAFKWNLVATTVVLFLLSVILHLVFCVDIGLSGPTCR